MELPKLACICLTYGRPELLPSAVESYLRQDYPADRCELIILDDAGQYASQSHNEPKRWSIVGVPRRFKTLGEKRNAAIALASPDADAYAVWDDDDIYLPHTLRAHAAALSMGDVSIASRVLVESESGDLKEQTTGDNLPYHAAWAFSAGAFKRSGGYPPICSGQDKGLLRRFRVNREIEVDPLEQGYAPYFICRWHVDDWHSSAKQGDQHYLDRTFEPAEVIQSITPAWPEKYAALT